MSKSYYVIKMEENTENINPQNNQVNGNGVLNSAQ